MTPEIGSVGRGSSPRPWRPGMLPPPSPSPVLTVYAPPDGRTELSGTTLGNWVAKATNLLVLDEGLEPGDVVHVDLSPDWDLAMWCQAVWVAGATVSVPPGPADAASLLITRGEARDEAVVDANTRAETAGLPTLTSDVRLLGNPTATGSVDADETAGRLRAQPDDLVLPASGLGPAQSAIIWGNPDEALTADQACATATRWASAAGLGPGDRVVLAPANHAPTSPGATGDATAGDTSGVAGDAMPGPTRDPASGPMLDVLTTAVLPLHPGISVVLVSTPIGAGVTAASVASTLDTATLQRIADQERATIRPR